MNDDSRRFFQNKYIFFSITSKKESGMGNMHNVLNASIAILHRILQCDRK